MSSIYETIDVAHLVVVVYDESRVADSGWGRIPARYRAECSCGWSGEWHRDGAAAEADGDGHREVVIGPGDHLDRLMSELLDVQDDLAQAVMWLAEHWSADLPVPNARGRLRSPAGIELTTYCGSDELLSRVGALLGVPVVEDPGPDSNGNRYRRAIRRFGCVSIELFRSIDPAQGSEAAA